MPVAPTDSVETALNMARVRLNDAIQSLAGDILTDTAPFTLVAVNNAWRRLQELLVNFGFAWLKPETILTSVPAVTNSDPGSQMYISWSVCFDGTTAQVGPLLPQDMIAPLVLWERVNGTAGSFYPMDRLDNGLPAVPKTMLNKSWEWRNGSIFVPGATSITDIRIRYAGFESDFVAPSGVVGAIPFANQPIPIVRAANALAWFICSEVAKARGDVDGGDFDTKAVTTAQMIFNLDPMQARSIEKESGYNRMTDQYTPTEGPAGPRGMPKGA